MILRIKISLNNIILTLAHIDKTVFTISFYSLVYSFYLNTFMEGSPTAIFTGDTDLLASITINRNRDIPHNICCSAICSTDTRDGAHFLSCQLNRCIVHLN